MIKPKPKVQLGAKKLLDSWAAQGGAESAILELFPPKAETAPLPLPEPRPARWRGCVCCGAKDALPAAVGHDVCARCVVDPPATATALRAPRAEALREADAAMVAYKEAEAALDEGEATRWATFCDLWIIVDAGMADDEQRRKVRATQEAYAAPAHPRITPGLRRVWAAWECMWWADQAAVGRLRMLEVKLAQLGLCLESLGRKDEADALYTTKGAAA